ncbi:MAG: DUF3823 domain-containing protein [Bacteroidales bacterium]|nr:DUF3823 domain-containing protein [Bacteroidales bacterium]
MKKIVLLLSLLLTATACDWFVFDNQEGWDAQVAGRILDSKTGEPVQFAWPNTSTISIIEQGWDDEKAQTWYVKCDGSYCNKLAWSGSYVMDTKKQNFYPVSLPFTLAKGANTVDFTVTPYARILDPVITYEGNKIVARFKVEVADAAQTPNVDVALFGFTDRWVSDGNNNFNFDKNQKNGKKKKIKKIDGSTLIELSIDTTVESGAQFAYKREHFLRIGAVATGTANSGKCYNYSPVFKMSGDFSKVEEVTDWEEE